MTHSESHNGSGRFLPRRTLLRGSGVAMGLPYLTSMTPAHAAQSSQPPRRFVAFTLGLGLLAENLYPQQTGRDYEPSRYMKALQPVRDDVTVISGCSHPGVSGGHRAEASILTASPMGASGGSRNTISIDQLLAKHLGGTTRFPSLTLSVEGSTSPCYTESGAMIPPIDDASDLFELLFVDGSKAERQRRAADVARGRSIMDLVSEDAKSLAGQLGPGDRDRLDAYFTSVRELEKRMQMSESWATKPKPRVDVPGVEKVRDRADFVAKMKVMTDVMKLAIQTDSTRFLTLHLGGGNHKLPREGVQDGYHTLSHHGMDEEKLEQLAIVETELIATWGGFLEMLSATEEGGNRLPDQTNVLMPSNLGNASNHNNRNMPVLFGGGGFRHAGHLAFDEKNNYPLPNLYLSVLQRAGLETDRFATSTGTMEGLSMA